MNLITASLAVFGCAWALAAPPPAPSPNSLYAWYRSDAGLEANALAQVTLWRNQATTGTPASRNLDRISGTPESASFNTAGGVRRIVRCDGGDAVWGTSANFGTITSSRALVAYCRLTAANDGFLFDGSANAPGLTRAQVRAGSWQVGLQPSGGGSNADPNTLAAAVNVWQTHIFEFDKLAAATRVRHSIGGGERFIYTNNLTSGLGGLILGKNVAATRGLAVDLAEVLVYDRVLTDAERIEIPAYLSAQWGSPEEIPPAACTVAQTTRDVPPFGLHALLDVQVRGPGVVTNVAFNLEGTTDLADIASVAVFFTGPSPEFRPLNAFGSVAAGFDGALSVGGSQELSAGVNHFWIAVEPRPGTKWGRVFDGALLSVGFEGEVRVPEVGSPPEFLTVGNALFSTVVRRAGDDGVHTYRIPALATTTRGTLLAMFDLRWDNANDLPANVDVGCMRSTDNGSTWHWATNTKAILDYDKTVAGSSGNGVGDPAVLVDRETGTIWVAALWSFGNRAYAGSGAGLGTNQTGQYVLARSDDDGQTWSPPINITAQAKANPSWGVCFQGPGHGIQLRDGILLFPSQHTDPGGVNARAFFIYSTNHGASWLTSPDVNRTIPPQLNENQMVELNSGQIMVSSRAPSGGGGKRVWATYSRGATLSDGTWSPLTYAVADPVCQASFIRYSSTLDGAPRDRLLFANPGSASARVDMTVRMSEDEGKTWTVSRRIDTRPAAYSDLAVLADGTVGLLYETGDGNAYETLTFVRFHLDWLTQADLDGDGDGMSDYYEAINGLNHGADDAEEDLDGDGMSNVDEFEAGTMANDPSSLLRIEYVSVGPDGLRLVWSSLPGALYAVQGAADLTVGWTPQAGGEEVLADGFRVARIMPGSLAGHRFFRVATPRRR